MEHKNIKVIIPILIIGIILVVGFYFIKNEVIAVDSQVSTRTTYVKTPGNLAEGEKEPSTYSYYIDTGEFEALERIPMAPNVPIYNGFDLYCLEPGDPIQYTYQIRLAEARNFVLRGEPYTGYCGCGNPPREGDFTPPVYKPISFHSLSRAAAYIVSDSPVGCFSLEKQKGLWNIRNAQVYNALTGKYEDADEGLITGGGISKADGPTRFDTEAIDYAEYDYVVRENGLQPEDKTNLKKIEGKVNQKTGEYTVGPYNIEYTEGIYGNVTFSGISNMTVLGYNSKKELVRDDIKVEKIILKDLETGLYEKNGKVPQYFEPSEDLKVDRSEQVYPSSGQDFEILFKDPNEGLEYDDENRVEYIAIKVNFKYMLANGEYAKLQGIKYVIKYTTRHNHVTHTHGKPPVPCYNCVNRKPYLEEYDEQQWLASADAIRSIYEQEIIIGIRGPTPFDITMNLGGHVWEDSLATKESKADGISNTAGENLDRPLKNVKVTLYTEDGEIAKLITDPEEEGISDEKLMHRVNPTYTNENGNYLFEGLDAQKKYYVVFEYNGQTYLPTEYMNTANGQYNSVTQMVNAGLYNTDSWKVNSKGTESESKTFDGVEISRQQYDQRFSEIRSYPQNYPSSNSLNKVGSYNAVYTQLDLMGYTLNDSGKYSKTGVQLVDGYTYDENGLQTTTFSEGVISKSVRDYIKQYKEFPNDNAMKTIYAKIAGNDQEIWRQLQFIEDCYIQAYTGSPFTQNMDIYPVYDYIRINHTEDYDTYDTAEDYQNANYSTNSITLDGVTYEPIYPGQFFVNLGLWRRQEFDASLRKDVYKAALKINDKTVVYNYDKRAAEQEGANSANGQDNNTYWDINVRMSDYEAYYNTGYNREIYATDYSYDSAALEHPGSDLEVYITYKLTIRNQSMSIMGEIKEIVDYYDSEYTFKPNLSWAMYQDKANKNYNTSVNKDEYYAMMSQKQDVIDKENTKATSFITDSKEAKVYENDSRYNNEKDLGNQYSNLYIRGLEGQKLETGETAYIYLTFEINKDKNGKIVLDDESNPKENLAEINGFSTYYADGTQLPNKVNKNSNNIAGLLDRDSNPGNLVADDLKGEKFEKNFEDDTDKAPSLRVLIDENAVRKANGTVWEDERTETIGEAIVGDGIRQDDETKVSGVTVQLVEKCTDGSEYIWQETSTNEDGYYNFESYIPGDYVIRFYYGDTAATAIPSKEQPVSYNGQDFKSTTYQDGIDQQGVTDTLGRYQGYVHTDTQNVSGTYNPDLTYAPNGPEANTPTDNTFGYNIYKSDNADENYSDAKDIWTTTNRNGLNIIGPVNSARLVHGRDSVIDYSDNDVTNHIAEVLASPYSGDTSLYNELMDNTYMTAETGIIAVEFEYDRQQTDGLNRTINDRNNSSKDYVGNDNPNVDNRYNSNYTLNNIDLGLTERPKAQLEIDKSIANIKVTLANGSILFDINEAANNALWQDHEEYSVDENIKNGKYEEYYGKDNKHRYSFREEIDDIVRDTDKGLVQLTMDEELMHGATIQITYTVKITNVGEVDYIDGDYKNFYYKGNTDGTSVVRTLTDQVIDYVQNNLQFEAANEFNAKDGWKAINANDALNSDLVNKRLQQKLTEFNTILQTESFNNTYLEPGDETSKTLILTQLITPENTSDDLTYTNMVEIVKTSNDVGRRMAYSVVGNQDPSLDDASEIDSSVAERVVILPPFGQTQIYYLLASIVAIILIGGIVLIIRKVLKKKTE